jgi:phage terminase large subunit
VSASAVKIQFPPALEGIFEPARTKVFRGGRGGGKSWSVARALLLIALQRKIRVLCSRETQKSIRDSVHKLLVDQIARLGFAQYFTIQQVQISAVNGSEFIFAGLSDQTADSIKSYEGVDICWIEEGQVVTDRSWTILMPTLFRTGRCELWISFNPELDTDPTWVRFIEKPPPGTRHFEVNWRDNPWFPPELNELRLHDSRTLKLYEYEWIWEGKCKPAVSGAIYADELANMFAEGRVGLFPVSPQLPVFAVFDLGWNDKTAIIVFQRHISALRIADYIEDSHKPIDWYSGELRAKPYRVQELYLPHDGAHNHLTGQSTQRTLEDLRWRVTVLPRQNVEEGLRAARLGFRQLYINSSCTRLVECLKRYRRNIPSTTGEPSAPLHDEFSHGSDAVRGLFQAAPLTDTQGFEAGVGLKLPQLKYARNM